MASETAHDRGLRFWAERKVSHLEDREAAALLDALLREQGKQRIWAVHTPGGHYQRCASESLALRKADWLKDNGEDATVVEVHVPVQGGGE